MGSSTATGVPGTFRVADLPGRPCAIAAGLEVVGERWALLVVRELALGEHRFSGIVTGTGAPRDRVAARLRALVEAGIVVRRPYSAHPPRDEYHLTDSGRDLLPVLDALGEWGLRHVVAVDDPGRGRTRRHLATSPPGRTAPE